MRKIRLLFSATLGLALAFTLSCSSGDGNGDGSDGEELTTTLDIKDITDNSFTMVETNYWCRENGILEEKIYEYPTSYAISGSTLSFGKAQFSGNSHSLIGTWNSLSLQKVEFFNSGVVDNPGYGYVSKAVFTLNTLVLTQCIGEPGYEGPWKNGVKYKVIDCGMVEYTKGNETIKLSVSGTVATYTYNDKICNLFWNYSKSQRQKACSDAYDKVMEENPGYNGNGYEVDDYYDEILRNDFYSCMEDFPAWFLGE